MVITTNIHECLKESKLSYSYKEDVVIPPLGMVDDVLAVSACGSESVARNAFLNDIVQYPYPYPP